MTLQKVFCQICAKSFPTQFTAEEWFGEVCQESCHQELEERKSLAEKNIPKKFQRCLRVAELDPNDELDPLIEDLRSSHDLVIDRYVIDPPAYNLFKAAPPEAALDFPIATLEEGPLGEKINRVYGLEAVKALLIELSATACYAVTRKIKYEKKK